MILIILSLLSFIYYPFMRKYQKPNPLFNFSNIFSKSRTTSLTQSSPTPQSHETFPNFIPYHHISSHQQNHKSKNRQYSMNSSFISETSKSHVFADDCDGKKSPRVVGRESMVLKRERKVVTPEPMVRIDLYGLEKERRKEKMSIFVKQKNL